MVQSLEQGRLKRAIALYHYAMGRKSEAVGSAMEALRHYSDACDEVPKEHRQQTISLMKDVYDLASGLKEGKKVLNHSEKLAILASRINGNDFFPWTDDPIEQEFGYEYQEEELKLSALQQKVFKGWERPHKAIGPNIDHSFTNVCMLYQDSLEDCSVVASLLSAIYLEKRTGNSILKGRIFPGKFESQGKYHVKIRVNGVDRRVVIDDRLPCSSTDQSLFVQSDTNAVWPALFEKAYIKVMGGYDFVGSHACLDTYCFTSWFPEYIPLHVESAQHKSIDSIWNRAYTGWKNGDLMVCIGTSQDLAIENQDYGLVRGHDYTILDMKQTENGDKLILVKNPWKSKAKSLPPFAITDLDVGNGSFWMEFGMIRTWFQNLYLNWNPRMFQHEQKMHFTWECQHIKYSQQTKSCWYSPQFVLENESPHDSFITLLIMRHTQNRPFEGYMNCTIYDTANRIPTGHAAKVLAEGTAINTSYIIVRFSIPARSKCVAIPQITDMVTTINVLQCTMTVYSIDPIKLRRAADPLGFKCIEDGEWTQQTSGGSWSGPMYNKNPQYKLVLTELTEVRIMLFSCTDLPIHVQMFWSRGRPIRGYADKDVICASGQYKPGCCIASTRPIGPGEYTIVVSSFNPELGKFRLVALSRDATFSLSPLPAETSGLFCRSIRREWKGGNRQDILFKVDRSCEATFHLYTMPKNSSPSTYKPNLRLSVYKGTELVGSTQNFSDLIYGIYLDTIPLSSNTTYVVTLERMEAGHGSYSLETFSASPVQYIVD